MTFLQVRMEAADLPVGHLESTDEGGIEFTYNPEYLHQLGAHPISMALPLREEPFSDYLARPFFQNLLPENDQLRAVIEREGLDQSDLVGILHHVGADLAGALSCLPIDSPPSKIPGNLHTDYLNLDDEQLLEIVQRLGSRRPLPDELRDPSPVAGYQQKIALVSSPRGFAVPRPNLGVPTTHILKVPDTSLPREAFYEAWAADIGRNVGLQVAPSQSLWIGEYEVLLATRFDRTIEEDGSISRIHQEDFAQALGLPPRLKYEREGREGRAYTAAAIAGLLQVTASPAESIGQFLLATFFNLCIGNTDNHAKNHALIYDVGPIPRLAPLYDLVPIRLSENHHHRFAFSLGNAKQAEDLTPPDLRLFLGAFGYSAAAAERYIERRLVPLLQRLSCPREASDPWSQKLMTLVAMESSRLLELTQAGTPARA
jgi:serine/threonine-protein kinase HipA